MKASSDPIEVFEATVRALQEEDWRGVVDLCDQESLAAMHRRIVRPYERRDRSELTVETYLRHAPDMPREVAEYHVAQAQKMADEDFPFASAFPGVESIGDIRGMGPRDFYAKWLESNSPRRQIARMVEQGRAPQEALSITARDLKNFYERTAIGYVLDGKDVAHVLYRQSPAEPTGDPLGEPLEGSPGETDAFTSKVGPRLNPSVMTLTRQKDGGWALIADEALLGTGAIYFDSARLVEDDDRGNVV